MSNTEITKEIDARGSACPGPLMELIRGIKAAQTGETVAVLSSDQGSQVDIPEWVKKAGYNLVAVEPEEGYVRFVVNKSR